MFQSTFRIEVSIDLKRGVFDGQFDSLAFRIFFKFSTEIANMTVKK